MGTGSEELGRLLMKACINTLEELSPRPAVLVFYNAGVKLACKGSPVLSSLVELEAQGTKLLVCGTCLDYFKLKENLAVGTVSNMLDILQMIASGDPIISP